MDCILCFLEDSYQEQLRNECQKKYSNYGEVLNEYERLFFQNMNNVLKCNQMYCHCKHELQNKKQCFYKANMLKDYFSEFSGSCLNAFKRVKEKNLSDAFIQDSFKTTDEILSNKIIYRGYCINDAKNLPATMAPIPYSKKNIAGNNRFSESGNPEMYNAFSVLCCKEELESPDEKIPDNFYIGAFFANDPFLNGYDLTNPFNNYITRNEIIQNENYYLAYDHLINQFIISQVCMLKNHYDMSQKVAQIIKGSRENLFCDGIYYKSARISYKWEMKNKPEQNIDCEIYNKNLMFFLDYMGNEDKHPQVEKKFWGTSPFNFNNPQIPTNLEELTSDLKQNILTISKKPTLESVALNGFYNQNIEIYDNLIHEDGTKYYDTQIGKLQKYMAYLCVKEKYNEYERQHGSHLEN
jgi:hypothetical protein